MTDLHLWLIPLVPLAGFLVNGLLGRRFSKPVDRLSPVASLIPLAQVAVIVTKSAPSICLILKTSARIQAGSFHADFPSNSISSRLSCSDSHRRRISDPRLLRQLMGETTL